MVEVAVSVKAPIPLVPGAPSERPPVLNVSPLSVKVAPLLIRSVTPLLPLSSNVPPEFSVIPLVPASLPLVRVLLISSVPPLTPVVPL
jgi:hypothetical protein